MAVPPSTNHSCSTSLAHESCICAYDTMLYYDLVVGYISRTQLGKVFITRFNEASHPHFRNYLQLTLSNIQLHLKKMVTQDM